MCINLDKKEFTLKLGKEINWLWEWGEDICWLTISLISTPTKKLIEFKEKMWFLDFRINFLCKTSQQKQIFHMKWVHLDLLKEKIKVYQSHLLQNLQKDKILKLQGKEKPHLTKKVNIPNFCRNHQENIENLFLIYFNN